MAFFLFYYDWACQYVWWALILLLQNLQAAWYTRHTEHSKLILVVHLLSPNVCYISCRTYLLIASNVTRSGWQILTKPTMEGENRLTCSILLPLWYVNEYTLYIDALEAGFGDGSTVNHSLNEVNTRLPLATIPRGRPKVTPITCVHIPG